MCATSTFIFVISSLCATTRVGGSGASALEGSSFASATFDYKR